MRRIACGLTLAALVLSLAGIAAAQLHGLTGSYYSHFTRPDDVITFDEADLEFTRVDSIIDFWPAIDCYYRWNSVPISPEWYGVRWQGHLIVEDPGDYGFGIMSDDGSQLWVDGDLIVNNVEEQWYDWEDCIAEGSYTGLYPEGYGLPDTLRGPITLSAGLHALDLRFFEARNYEGIELWWLRPGSGPSDIPYYGQHCQSGLTLNPATNWEIIPAAHLLPAPVATPELRPPTASLHPALPNPFNPSTKLRFELAAAAQVELSIHDLSGRRLIVVDRGRRDAGNYALTWDGRDADGNALPSGVYLLRLRADGETLHRKLTLLK